MGVDNETVPTSVWIQIEDSKKFLDELREKGKEFADDDEKTLLLTDDVGGLECTEYYFDESDNAIYISFSIGESYVSLSIPLSDTVFIDIIEHSMKKLAKLKTAMEALK